MADNVENFLPLIVGSIVGLVVYVFTSHSNTTSKRIDARSSENQQNSEEISKIKGVLSGFEQKILSLEKGQEKNEKLIYEKFERLEEKIDRIIESLLHSNRSKTISKSKDGD